MLDSLFDLIDYLNGPKPVAGIQRFFGIERITKPDKKKKSSLEYDDEELSSICDGKTEEYIIHNYFWYWFFHVGTSLGNEIFYAIAFPYWFWNIDGAVGRRISLLWGISMFAGQCLKDILCWHRPKCPPVVRMETKCALEYGMPSTHSLGSVIVPLSLVLLTTSRYDYDMHLGLVIAFFWCLYVSLSRIYLGMHSIGDILGGIALALVLLVLFFPFLDALDAFLLTHPAAPGLLITTTVTLMLVYPGSKFSEAKEDSAVILGFSSGLLLGSWLGYQMGSIRGPPIEPPYAIIWPSFEMFVLSLWRMVIGLIALVSTRALLKPWAHAVLRTLLVNRESRQQDKIKRLEEEMWVKVGGKLVVYAAVGVTAIWVVPAIFRLLNIERIAFHTEI